MSGKPVGTVFVELDLDASKYTKGQQAILAQSTSTCLDVEKNWKTLGEKSDVIINAQRQNVINAYDMIANRAGSSADEIVRAEQAKNDKLNALNQQQFGQQTSLLDTLKSNWLMATAAIYGAMKLVGEGMEYIQLGAKALQTEEAFRNTASAWHIDADAMVADLKRLTVGTIDDSDLMQKAMKGMSAGLSPNTIVQIAEISRTAARRMGVDVGQAYSDIADAVETMRARSLVAYGLLNKEEASWIQRLQSSGVEYNMMPLVMANYRLEQERIGVATDNASEALQRHMAQVKQFKEDIGKDLITAIGTAIEWWGKLKQTYYDVGDAYLKAMGAPSRPGAQGTGAPGSPITMAITPPAAPDTSVQDAQSAKAMEDARLKALAFKSQTDALAQSFEAWKTKIADLNPYLNQTEKEMATLNTEAQKFITGKPGIGGIPASDVNAQLAIAQQNMAAKQSIENQKILSEEMDKSQKKEQEYSKEYDTLWKQVGGDRVTAQGDALAKIDAAENEAKYKATVLWQSSTFDYETGQIKMAITTEQYQDLMTKATEKGVTERTKITDQYETKRAETNATLLQNIRGQEETLYGFEVQLLDTKAQKYRDEGADELAIQAWKNDQLQIYAIKRARTEQDATAGAKAAILDIYRTQMTYGEAGYQAIVGSYKAMNDTFSTVFADGMKGQLSSLHDYWMSYWNSMADALGKVLGKMVTDWIYSMFEMRQSSDSILGGLFGSGSGGGGGGILGAISGGLGNLLGGSGIFGGFTSFGSFFSSLFPQSIATVAETAPEIFMLHGGGVVGQDGTRRTDVSPAVFAGAPRLHRGGLAPDEVPTILQKGERVTPRGRAGQSIVLNLNVAGDLVDHDKFARKLLPALQKALAQGVH